MATESKLVAEQQNTIGKGTKEGSTRAKERKNTRASESTRERKREKQRESKPSERRTGGKTRSRCRCPRRCTRAPSSWEGTGDPPRGRMKNGLNRKQRKKHEYSWMNKGRCHGWRIWVVRAKSNLRKTKKRGGIFIFFGFFFFLKLLFYIIYIYFLSIFFLFFLP
jgi:hypothetical protein